MGGADVRFPAGTGCRRPTSPPFGGAAHLGGILRTGGHGCGQGGGKLLRQFLKIEKCPVGGQSQSRAQEPKNPLQTLAGPQLTGVLLDALRGGYPFHVPAAR